MASNDVNAETCETDNAEASDDVVATVEVDTGRNGVAEEAPRNVQVQGLPLDWTQLSSGGTERAIRYPSDVAEIDVTDDELCIVGTAGQKITNMGPDFSATMNPNLRRLILRSHVIRKIEGLQHFACLELLELYDNQVESLSTCLDSNEGRPGTTLLVLDMSYNSIRDMGPVALCPNLQELCTFVLLHSRLFPIDFEVRLPTSERKANRKLWRLRIEMRS
jgi:hypothetical protein